jgi:paraquat-inducible protein B
MSKQANPKLIGGFVVGAIAIAIAGLLVFGGRDLFVRKERFVLFFSDTVNGLDVGAPVRMRGVTIGRVTGIQAILDREKERILIPVYIETDEGRIEDLSGDADLTWEQEKESIKGLIQRGMRAQLVPQSLVTGKLFVKFDFHKGAPLHYVVGLDKKVMELPTIPSTQEQVFGTLRKAMAKIAQLPLDKILEKLSMALGKLDSVMDEVDTIIHSPQLMDTVKNLNKFSQDLQGLITNLDTQVAPLATSIQDTMADTRALVHTANARLRPLTDSAIAALDQARDTLAGYQSVVDKSTPLGYELYRMLTEMGAAARSLRLLANYLERHPEALLKGKTPIGGRP